MNLRTLLAPAAAAAALALAALPGAALAADEDPNLQQHLGDLAVVHGERVLDAGHVDMGPKFDEGRWRFLIHDDVAKADANATSVWRYPAETVFHVLDEARLEVPDDTAYSFIGAKPGSPIWVLPQTQHPDVVWLGWNTQDPEVMKRIDRGVTLSLTGVQGPGEVTVYLQSGTFGAPQVLWDSRKAETQPLWVDVNTHTHANWTFTEPGVYLVRLRAEADLKDGSHVSDSQLVRLAVGTGTAAEKAMTASWQGADEPEATADQASSPTATEAADEDGSVLVPILIGAIAVVAVGLVVSFAIALVRGNRARRQVLDARRGEPADEPADESAEEVR